MLNAIKYMDELEKNGFTQPQAKTSVNLWLELMNENLASKNEVKELGLLLKHDMKEMESSIRSDMKEMDIRLQSQINNLNDKLEKLIDLFKWSTGITFGLFAGLYLKLFFG